MPATKKTRKAHRKKTVSQNPVQRVIHGFTPVSTQKEALLAHKTKQVAALNKLKAGRAVVNDMNVLIDMVNLSESYKIATKITEHYHLIEAARQALIDLAARYRASGKFVAKGDEIKALIEIMELYDAQLDVLTVREVEDIGLLLMSAYKDDKWKGIQL